MAEKDYAERLLEKLMKNPAFRDEYEHSLPYAEIAQEVVRVRCEAGLSQAEMAARIGTSQAAIARIESLDYGRVNVQTLYRIAEALGLKLKVEFYRDAS